MSGNGVLADQVDREPGRRDQHAEDTRRAILAAARQAFARDGYAGTALEAIVGPARLTKGALYHHFKNKAAVLEAVYIEMEEELAARVTGAVASAPGGAWARMLAALDAFFAASAEPEYVRIVLRDAPLVLGPVHGREIDHAIGLGLVVSLVTELRDEGLLRPLPVVATARILLAAASEVAVAMACADDPAQARRDGTEVLLAMLDGLRASPTAGAASGSPESSTAAPGQAVATTMITRGR
ncbi:MAG TPA: TetR/AcrR family transcriptional regulator [Kofleriaceae bacterium]|nr:TetR/AcrR family transcriptional regulator [Kofleriaceae bacterium]